MGLNIKNKLKKKKLGEIPKDLPGITINDQKKLFDICNNDRYRSRLATKYFNEVKNYFNKEKNYNINIFKKLNNKILNS